MRRVLVRLVGSLLVLLGVSVLSFVFTEIAPGDFFDQIRLERGIDQGTIEVLKNRIDPDRSLISRYLSWLGAVVRGDLGFSFAHQRPVKELLRVAARNTLILTIPATLLSWLLALSLGVWVAASRSQLLDGLFGALTSVLLALPELLLALLLLWVAVRTNLFPVGGMWSAALHEPGGLSRFSDLARHLMLPLCATVLSTFPFLARHVQAAVGEVLEKPYIQAVRGVGMRERKILFRHVLRAAANPLLSLFGLSIASLLSASLLVEVIMAWPGMGPLLLQAIFSRDVYLVIGVVMASSVLLVFGNLVADILLMALDPRVRES